GGVMAVIVSADGHRHPHRVGRSAPRTRVAPVRPTPVAVPERDRRGTLAPRGELPRETAAAAGLPRAAVGPVVAALLGEHRRIGRPGEVPRVADRRVDRAQVHAQHLALAQLCAAVGGAHLDRSRAPSGEDDEQRRGQRRPAPHAAPAPMAWYPPSTCTISPVVAGNQSDSSARQARAAGSWSPRSQPSGARSTQAPSNLSKPGIDFAAMVRSGPAATRLTRTPCGPNSRARYRDA